MTNEEFQKLILEGLKSIRREMATKDDIARLDAKIDAVKSELKADIAVLDAKVEQYGQLQQNDVYHLLQLINKKIDRQEAKFDVLTHHVIENETDIQLLKKAK